MTTIEGTLAGDDYDEFGFLHENASEWGLSGPLPKARREVVEVAPGQLVSAIVRLHLSEFKSGSPSGMAGKEFERGRSRSTLQQLLDEQLHPLREQLKRLESQLQGVQ